MRYTRQDLNAMLYQALTPMKDVITGGIYIGDERPNNSQLEDISINTPSITLDVMQQAYSNINIYVPRVTIQDEHGSRLAYNPRANELTRQAVALLLGEKVAHGVLSVESEAEEGNPEGYEQFINIRVEWRILKDNG